MNETAALAARNRPIGTFLQQFIPVPGAVVIIRLVAALLAYDIELQNGRGSLLATG
jgi:hypothetical protein